MCSLPSKASPSARGFGTTDLRSRNHGLSGAACALARGICGLSSKGGFAVQSLCPAKLSRPISTDILGNDAVREDQFLRFIVSLDISKENSVSISAKNGPDSATDFHSLAKPHAHIALIISAGIHPRAPQVVPITTERQSRLAI